MSILTGYIGGGVKLKNLQNFNFSFRLYLLIVFQFALLSLNAQIYPVTLTSILLPPYPQYLSDCFDGTTERLSVILLNTDLQKPALDVKLRMFMEGPGLKLQSKDNAYFPALSLDAGMPRRLNLKDLAPYFRPENLHFLGTSSSVNSRRDKLPEGLYSICFQVLEVSTNRILSSKSCCRAWISLNDPPILNLPLNGESVAASGVQNIIFQWTPRNLSNSTGYFNTEYEFTLKELWDSTTPPQTAFQHTPLFYRTTIKNTMLLIGPSEPQLIPGKRYAWQIRAKSSSVSQQETADYRNDGYSEIFCFTYQNNCSPPFAINVEITGLHAHLTWVNNIKTVQDASGYSVQYREYNSSSWFTINTLYPKLKLLNLKPGTEYECRVGNRCDLSSINITANQTTYSNILKFKIDHVDDADSVKNCGIISPDVKITNHLPIRSLNSGELIIAGGFPVMITKVSGSYSFLGEGYVTMPFLGHNIVKVRFGNIKVNTDRMLFDGIIETVYDSTESQVTNINKIIEGGYGSGSVQTGKDYADLVVGFIIKNVDDIGVEWKKNPDDTSQSLMVTVKGGAGEITVLHPKELPVTLKDSQGTLYNIQTNENGFPIIAEVGKQEVLTMASAELNTLDTAKGYVFFKPHPKQKFAFDGYQPEHAKSKIFGSDVYEKLTGNYFVNAKAVLPGKTDLVIATVELKDKILVADSIEFITAEGTRLTKRKVTENTFEVLVIGGPPNDAQELFAVYPKSDGKYYTLGKLLVASYQPKLINLMLVPVNEATVDGESIEKQINAIYNPIGIKLKVIKADNFNNSQWDLNNDGKLAVRGSSWFSTQTAEMKALNNAYKQATASLANDMPVLFVLNESDSTINIKGDMPRGKQFGYLFKGADGNTVAHEIGHGIFCLEHTFKKYGFDKADLQGNVMNYPPGDKFTKFQWDAIHAPGVVIGIFEDDEDTMYETDGHFSTVYLISLMLGMSKSKAEELATATEAPDTKIHSPIEYELNQTWFYPTVQQNVHALTGGFHGVEEFITALKILYTPNEKIKEIGELLHRFGDIYAHTELDNLKPNSLPAYTLNNKPELMKLAIDNWKGQGTQKLATKIEPWIDYFNYCIKKYGLKFLSDQNFQKEHLNNKTLEQTMRDIYLLEPEDKFKMYGGKFATIEHAFVDSTYPDLIYMRPEWYLSYVKNLAWVIATKYNLNELALDYSVFKKMVDFSIKRKCSLKGIIDYEISKKMNRKEVYVPVFYSKAGMPAASFDAIFLTDYYRTAKDAANQTREYILQDGRKNVRVESEDGKKTKYGSKTGFFKTLAFKIIYN